jgi:hypothetical protein
MVLVFRLATSVPPALRLITSLLNTYVSRSGIHQRFSEKATEFLKRCLQIIIIKRIMSDQPISTELLDRFKHIYITDSSGWDLSPQLKEIFTGSGGSASEANCKLQFCYDYKTGSIVLLEDTKGTNPDNKYSINIGSLAGKGDLHLSDLGYWLFDTFYKIDSNGGFFASRFNNCVNIYKEVDGKLLNLDLVEILDKEIYNSIEIEVIIKGSKKNEILKIRLIAFRVPQEIANIRRRELNRKARKKGRTPTKKSLKLCDWSIFCTNAPDELIPAEMIRTIYRIRWAIELNFRNWKSILRIHESNVKKNHHRVKCELYAKLILAVIVNTIHQNLQTYVWNREKREISFECLWKFIISRAESLHEAIKISMKRFSALINSLSPLMIINCEKYHQPSRKTTLQMVDEMIGDTEICGNKCNKNKCLPSLA